MDRKIKIIGVRDGVAKVEEIDHSLENLQGFVGGYIECVGLDTPRELGSVDLWCDEEFRFKQQPMHALPFEHPDMIGGDFFFASVDHKTGEMRSLSTEQQAWVLGKLTGYLTVVR